MNILQSNTLIWFFNKNVAVFVVLMAIHKLSNSEIIMKNLLEFLSNAYYNIKRLIWSSLYTHYLQRKLRNK